MSHAAFAAVLCLGELSAGERLAAFSLTSFANREHRAWPSTPVAAARAGLSRSQYLAARDHLARRGLVEIDAVGGGRGRSPVVWLRFAKLGPWAEVEVNPELTEAVLTHSRTRGAARLLLATLATVADEAGEITAMSAEELQSAAGMADSTYRRARTALLACGELILAQAGGGRARTNRWTIPDPRMIHPEPLAAAHRRAAPTPGLRPLMTTARPPQPTSKAQQSLSPGASRLRADERDTGGTASANPAQNRTVSGKNGPGSSGVSGRNPGQDRTVWRETPSQTPPETPPPNARAGREPQNPRTRQPPPSPPQGGPPQPVTIVEDYLTPKGRRRKRTVTIDLRQAAAQLQRPSDADDAAWQQIRDDLQSSVGEDQFSIWLAALELAGCANDTLLLACPTDTRAWVSGRYRELLQHVGTAHGRPTRVATETELQLLDALAADSAAPRLSVPIPLPDEHQEAI